MLSNLDDHTFVKKLIVDGTKFGIICQGSGAGGPCIKWCRFLNAITTDYYYLSKSAFDAVIFVPKRNVMFHGFGIFANWGRKDMKYEIKWLIDEQEYE